MRCTPSIVAALALLVSLTTFIARPDDCLACSCALQPTPTGGWTRETLIAQAEVVFRGTIIAAGPLADFGGGVTNGQYTVLFAVDQVWAGAPRRYYYVSAGQGGGDCTIPFRVGDAWLVYGYGDPTADDLISTGICNRTAPSSGGTTGDLADLGRGTTPDAEHATSWLGALPGIGGQVELLLYLARLWE